MPYLTNTGKSCEGRNMESKVDQKPPKIMLSKLPELDVETLKKNSYMLVSPTSSFQPKSHMMNPLLPKCHCCLCHHRSQQPCSRAATSPHSFATFDHHSCRYHRRQCPPLSVTHMAATAFANQASLSLETEPACVASKAVGCLLKP